MEGQARGHCPYDYRLLIVDITWIFVYGSDRYSTLPHPNNLPTFCAK
jgi:hypothetical protein